MRFFIPDQKYKTREGEYDQIFWRIRQALRQRRPMVKLATYHRGKPNIVIDVAERYAWRFPESNIERIKLPVGDYALKSKKGIIAVVERKIQD